MYFAETKECRHAAIVKAGPGLPLRGEGLGGVGIPVGPTEGGNHLVPVHGVSETRVQLAQVAVLLKRRRRQAARDNERRLPGAREYRAIDRDRIVELVRALQSFGEGLSLFATQIGQTRAPLGSADDARHVAVGLAVTHQDQTRPTRLVAAGTKSLGWFNRHQLRPPTKVSS